MNHVSSLFRGLIILVIACFVALGGANAADGKAPHRRGHKPAARLEREFKLRAGEQVEVKGTALRIKFVAVEGDSRCPTDVTCVWAGNAAVQLQLRAGKHTDFVTLNTARSSSMAGETEYRGYKITLVDLSPYPHSKRRIPAGGYTVTLLVSKE